MTQPLTVGRWFALCLLTVYALQVGSNFGLQPALRQGTEPLALLVGAAAQPGLVGGIALLGLLSGVVELAGASLLVCWLQGRRGHGWALLYLGVCAAGLAASLAEHAMQLALREVGQAFGTLGGTPDALVLQKLLAALRNGLHFPRMVLGGCSVLVFFAMTWHAGVLPRVLAVLGLLASASQMAGVSAAVLGGAVLMPLLVPLLIAHLATALWLIARGFQPPSA